MLKAWDPAAAIFRVIYLYTSSKLSSDPLSRHRRLRDPKTQEEIEIMADTSNFSFDPIEEALEAFGKGEFVVVMDDESRENEGDLCIAASEITTEKMAFFIRHTR
jgi:hypothetical protein